MEALIWLLYRTCGNSLALASTPLFSASSSIVTGLWLFGIGGTFAGFLFPPFLRFTVEAFTGILDGEGSTKQTICMKLQNKWLVWILILYLGDLNSCVWHKCKWSWPWEWSHYINKLLANQCVKARSSLVKTSQQSSLSISNSSNRLSIIAQYKSHAQPCISLQI